VHEKGRSAFEPASQTLGSTGRAIEPPRQGQQDRDSDEGSTDTVILADHRVLDHVGYEQDDQEIEQSGLPQFAFPGKPECDQEEEVNEQGTKGLFRQGWSRAFARNDQMPKVVDVRKPSHRVNSIHFPPPNRFGAMGYTPSAMSTENMLTAGGAVIFNPAAGRGKGIERLDAAKRALGPEYEWVPTQRPGHAVELARELATRCPVVVAFGGDGTVGDVVRGIHGTGAILGIIPAGTGNDVARNLGLPLDPTEAARVIHEGSARSVDIGLVNGVPFINNAGTGFDSRVMQIMNTGIRFARGRLAFNLAILKTIFRYPPFALTLAIDDEPERLITDALLVSVLNGRVYGAGMPAAPEASMDDGRLDVLVVRNLPKLQRLPLLIKLQHAQHIGHPSVTMLRATRLRIAATPPQPMNVDGEIRGGTPVDILCESRALKVLVR